MESDKTCPRCHNNLPMQKSNFVSFVPTMGDAEHGTLPIIMHEMAGIPVRAHVCPRCQLVEFYHEDVSAPTQERQ
jgi:hypothetical protein